MRFQLQSQSKSFRLSFSAWPDCEPELPLLWNMSVEACRSLNCCLIYLVRHQKQVSMGLNVSVCLHPSASWCSRAAYETPFSHIFLKMEFGGLCLTIFATSQNPKHTCFTQRLAAGVWRWESKQCLSLSCFSFFRFLHFSDNNFSHFLFTACDTMNALPCKQLSHPPPLHHRRIFTSPSSITVQSGSKHLSLWLNKMPLEVIRFQHTDTFKIHIWYQ